METSRHNEAGFSVLEAMIAMAILAAGFLPLLAVQVKFGDTVEKLETVDTRMKAHEAAVRLVKAENFNQAPSGTFVSSDYEISWEVSPISKDKYVRTITGQPGAFTVSLYDVDLRIEYTTGRIENIQLRGLGWTKSEQIIDF